VNPTKHCVSDFEWRLPGKKQRAIPTGFRAGMALRLMNPDCTGTQTIVVAGMPDLHLQFVVSPSGNTFHFVVIDPGFATAGDSERTDNSRE
jgi:hypothetical protein